MTDFRQKKRKNIGFFTKASVKHSSLVQPITIKQITDNKKVR